MINFNRFLFLTTFAWASISYANISFAGEAIDESLAITDVASVSIENLSGDVTITGWDKPHITVKGELADEAEKLILEQVGNRVNISVVLPNQKRWNSAGSRLVIHMPSTIRTSFESVSSDVALNNLTHSIAVKTVSGDIQAKDIARNAELSTVSGNIKTDNLQGKISLVTVSGDIDDHHSTGRLNLRAVNGEITSTSSANEVFVKNVSGNTVLNLTKVDELKISTVSGDNEINLVLSDNGMLKVSNISGSTEVNFQQDIAADFRLKASAGGELMNKLSHDKAEDAQYGPSSTLYFQTGNANASVRISTVSGDVLIK